MLKASQKKLLPLKKIGIMMRQKIIIFFLFFGPIMSIQCLNANCAQQTMADGCLCVGCFEQKWGPNPICDVSLPLCLLNIVNEYLCLEQQRFHCDWLYFAINFYSHAQIANLLNLRDKQSGLDDRTELWAFIGDRYGRSRKLWTQINELDPQLSSYVVTFFNLDVAKIFIQCHYVPFTDFLLRVLMFEKTDDKLWFVLNNPNANAQQDLDHWVSTNQNLQEERKPWSHFIRRVGRWQSDRLLQLFIDRGYFKDEVSPEFFTNHSLPLYMFQRIWISHYGDVFDGEKHQSVLYCMLDASNMPQLRFLTTLKNFHIPSKCMGIFGTRINHKADMRQFLIENKHLMFDINRLFAWQFWELLVADVFQYWDSDVLTEYCIEHDVFVHMLTYIIYRINGLFRLLPQITHFGKNLKRFARCVCDALSLEEFCKLVTFPVIQKNFTFALMRHVRPTFVSRMFAKKPCLKHLRWLLSWRDCEQQTLTREDVQAKNNALLRLAYHTKNNELQTFLKAWVIV